jgi:hypothetical protein
MATTAKEISLVFINEDMVVKTLKQDKINKNCAKIRCHALGA